MVMCNLYYLLQLFDLQKPHSVQSYSNTLLSVEPLTTAIQSVMQLVTITKAIKIANIFPTVLSLIFYRPLTFTSILLLVFIPYIFFYFFPLASAFWAKNRKFLMQIYLRNVSFSLSIHPLKALSPLQCLFLLHL